MCSSFPRFTVHTHQSIDAGGVVRLWRVTYGNAGHGTGSKTRLRLHVLTDMHIGGCQVLSTVVTLRPQIDPLKGKCLRVLYLISLQEAGRVPCLSFVAHYVRPFRLALPQLDVFSGPDVSTPTYYMRETERAQVFD